MRKVLLLLLLAPSLAGGCSCFGGKQPSLGWEYRVYRPSQTEVTTPVILAQSSGSPSAQPIGGSGFLQQPLLVGPPAMMGQQQFQSFAATPCAQPILPAPRMATQGDCETLQQACDRIRALESKLSARPAVALPMPSAKE